MSDRESRGKAPPPELGLYTDMIRARKMEDAISSLFEKKLARGTTHLGTGQEAVSVGVISTLREDDFVVGTYRGHIAALAKGVSMFEIISEVLGKRTGCNGGFGGSMQLTKESVGLMGDFSIVGAGIPVATGLGLASRLKDDERVTVCFFGDGAANNGYFHESMNLASVHGVQTLFAIENNLYGEHTASSETSKVKDLTELVRPYGIQSVTCDGNDVEKVRETSAKAVEKIRSSRTPVVIEFKTYRTAGHSKLDKQLEGTQKERDDWLSKDPIHMLRSRLFERGVLDESGDAELHRMADAEVAASTERAIASPSPDPRTDTGVVFSDDRDPSAQEAGPDPQASTMSMRSAIRKGLTESMERDPSIVVFGEDVAQWGGVFKVTEGLRERFGGKRVWDTPISEASLVGMGLGLALGGYRPVVEIMFSDFLLMAMDAIGNEIAKRKAVTGGRSSVPLVIRTACGIQGGWGATHSQTFDTLFLSTPGVKIVTPSNAADARGLLCSALIGKDPVLFFEHKSLYSTTSTVPADYCTIPLGRARVAREGSDATIVANMSRVNEALSAAQMLEDQHDISAEIVDPRSLVPLDIETILSSVRKTGVLVTVEETNISAGWGNLVAASVAEKALYSLRAPVRRLAAPDTPVPYSPSLEDALLPDARRIADAVSELLAVST